MSKARVLRLGICIAAMTACESYYLSETAPGGGAPDAGDIGSDASGDRGAMRPRRIYVYGGSPDGIALPDEPDAFYAEILDDGLLGAWRPAPKPPATIIWHTGVQGPDFIALIGGIARPVGANLKYFIGAVADGAVTSFSSSSDLLPEKIAHAGAFVRGETLWIVGGEMVDGAAQAHVWRGALAAKTYAPPARTTDLPAPVTRMALAEAPDAIYLAGGSDATGALRTTIFRAAFVADGGLSTFEARGALPSGRNFVGAVVHGSSLIVVGGDDPTDLPNVLTCPIGPTGTVGACLETTPLPFARGRHRLVLFGDRLYVVGGHGPDGGQDVFVADITTEGTISSWRTTSALPVPAAYCAAFLL